MKITIDNSIFHLHNVFEKYAEVQYLPANDISKESVKDSDALIVRTTRKYGKETLEDTSLRFLGTVSIGFDHIDTGFCEQNGIYWTSAPGCNADSVTQYIFSALFEISAKLEKPLAEQTLGIIGVGQIGSRVHRIAKALGVNTILCDPPRKDKEGADCFVDLSLLLKASDIVTLHVPLVKDDSKYGTKYMANDAFFNNIKHGAWFINTSRGAVCDSTALLRALNSGKLGGAVIDVWENEPNINEALFPHLEIATPHIAGHSLEAKANAARIIAQLLGRHFHIRELENWQGHELKQEGEIYLDNNTDCETILAKAMKDIYDIRKDDREFRKNALKVFANRENYYRREPGAYKLKCEHAAQPLIDKLKALNFSTFKCT